MSCTSKLHKALDTPVFAAAPVYSLLRWMPQSLYVAHFHLTKKKKKIFALRGSCKIHMKSFSAGIMLCNSILLVSKSHVVWFLWYLDLGFCSSVALAKCYIPVEYTCNIFVFEMSQNVFVSNMVIQNKSLSWIMFCDRSFHGFASFHGLSTLYWNLCEWFVVIIFSVFVYGYLSCVLVLALIHFRKCLWRCLLRPAAVPSADQLFVSAGELIMSVV